MRNWLAHPGRPARAVTSQLPMPHILDCALAPCSTAPDAATHHATPTHAKALRRRGNCHEFVKLQSCTPVALTWPYAPPHARFQTKVSTASRPQTRMRGATNAFSATTPLVPSDSVGPAATHATPARGGLRLAGRSAPPSKEPHRNMLLVTDVHGISHSSAQALASTTPLGPRGVRVAFHFDSRIAPQRPPAKLAHKSTTMGAPWVPM